LLEDKLNELLKISKTITVLYVEDKGDVRESTASLLERMFGDISVAYDGRDGIEKYINFYQENREYYDLVISDVNMPRMNGIEMCKIITEINRKQTILIVSAYDDADMFINLIDVGINKFIQKPTKDSELILMLSKVVSDISIEKKRKENIKKIQDSNKDLKIKIDEEKEKSIKLNHLAITDKLTGLYNRVKLDKVLDIEILKALSSEKDISIIFIDIDKFKHINDTYGHQVGDQILKDFSLKLKNCIRKTDIIGRWGGEEFLIICKGTNLKESLCTAENLRSTIQNMKLETVNSITASFGVATLKDDDCAQSLLRRADAALYRSKENGRNRVSHE